MTLSGKSEKIKQFCRQLGFDDCGIVKAAELSDQKRFLRQWLDNGFYGEMAYMTRNFDKRLNPALLVPGAKSVIVVLLNYFPVQNLKLRHYKISKYAYGQDYHLVIKKRLWQLLELINRQIEPARGRAFTDSAPLLEKALAVRAGLGWIGKNSLLLTRRGSFFFIGELVIDLELAYDTPYVKSHCGNCTACIDACPAGALVEPYVLDARKCISYLTIEKRGEFENPVKLDGWVFGCDVCQDVCPWNKKAIPTAIDEFSPKPDLAGLTDERLESLTKQEFKKVFKGTPVERAKYEGFMRNVKAQEFYPVSRRPDGLAK